MPEFYKILHLEDSSADAELVERQLKKGNFQFQIKVVDTQPEFINALENFTPDIILSDHTLPAFNSAEALKIVKEKGIEIPFILVTATVSEEFAVAIIKAGASDYILKDRLQRLPDAVYKAVERYNFQKQKDSFLTEVIASEDLFKQAERIANFGIWKVDLLKRKITWSEETFRILGYEPGEVKPSLENFLQYVYPEDIHLAEEMIKNITTGSGSMKLDFRIKNRNGLVRFIRAQFVIKKNETGIPAYLLGFGQDITQAKLAEELLYKSEANLRAILDNSDTGYILLDPDLNVLSYNHSAEIFCREQLNREPKIGTYAIDYFPTEQHAAILEIMQTVLKGEMFRHEKNYIQKDGSSKWFDIRWMNLANVQNKKLGVIVSALEITERKLAEIERERITADLLQRNKDLEQFTYIVSHNLRAPLANIIGLSENFKHLGADADIDEKNLFLSLLDISAQKLDNIIRDLNYILQVKQNLNEKIEHISFSEIVENIKHNVEIIKSKEAVIFECDFSEVDNIHGLKSYLYSIFFNLISNSIKYKQEDRPAIIEIKSRRLENKTELVFKDNGLGIDMDKKASQVFGLYKRFHPEKEGKGLGLFMVKTQVESLGGTISIKSEPNKGTEFTIILP